MKTTWVDDTAAVVGMLDVVPPACTTNPALGSSIEFVQERCARLAMTGSSAKQTLRHVFHLGYLTCDFLKEAVIGVLIEV